MEGISIISQVGLYPYSGSFYLHPKKNLVSSETMVNGDSNSSEDDNEIEEQWESSWCLHSLRLNSFDSSFSELELPHSTLPGFFEWPPSLLLHPHHHHHTPLQLPVMAIHPQSPLFLPSIFSLSVTVSRRRRERDGCEGMLRIQTIVGDVTPSDGVSKHEKSRCEQEELDHMCKLLGGGQRAQEIGQLWREYEENLSLEAKVVKDFDKVEMILQALEYETEQGKNLDEFFLSTAGIILDPSN
ncbi:hypothetical protein HYC85_003564 [Camellia sinensis]|uniref:HD domain-containing protein n=1 Tax=Camellia sinensis TaxID=4442 RepID=A0A7J7HUL9_CAMSI|nr:hypothetical protein HYC85_003564 [Camellia sinensis]